MTFRTKLSVRSAVKLRKREAFFVCMLVDVYSGYREKKEFPERSYFNSVTLLMPLFDMLNFP